MLPRLDPLLDIFHDGFQLPLHAVDDLTLELRELDRLRLLLRLSGNELGGHVSDVSTSEGLGGWCLVYSADAVSCEVLLHISRDLGLKGLRV